MIRVIIFDFGGVISKVGNFDYICEKLHKKYNIDKEILKELIVLNWRKARINEIPSKDFWENIAKDIRIPTKRLRHDYLALDEINSEMLALIMTLKKKFKTVLLSNHIEDWLEELIVEYQLVNYFDFIVPSYKYRTSKPDKKLFEIIQKHFHVTSKECIVIDDQEKNTIAAESIGMKSILFKNKSVQNLIDELRETNISI